MLTLRPYCNADSHLILDLWSEKVEENPDFFAPLTMDVLESQVLGNILFDPTGFLLAFDGAETVGFLHASYAPNQRGSDINPTTGILFAPVIRNRHSRRDEIARGLIFAGERYLLSRGVSQWSVGGYASASPFWTGLYGRCNPEGINESEKNLLEIFPQLGYQPFDRSRLFRFDSTEFEPSSGAHYAEIKRQYIVRRMPAWIAPTWWDANIFRNFLTTEWNVFPRTDRLTYPPAIAGALIHRMIVPTRSIVDDGSETVHLLLSYIGVAEQVLRQGIGSYLFSSIVNELLAGEVLPLVIDTLVPERDERLAAFFIRQGYQEFGSVRSFYKRV